MKRYFVLCLIGGFMWNLTVLAQQIPISTIFMENPFAFNPAIAGTDNKFLLRVNHRSQWLGFADAPITEQFSAFGPTKTRNLGYGGNINFDKTGPISTLKLNGAFASNFAINFDMRVSFGLNLGLIQYRADGTVFELYDPEPDPRAPQTVMAKFLPDGGAGVYVYHNDWYVGLSAQQLFNNNLKLAPGSEDSKRNRLRTHFYGYAGYKFADGVMKNLVVEPSVLIRKVVANPMQLDLSTRVIIKQRFWGGLSARNTFESFNDLSLLVGYLHNKTLQVSLAYDFTFAQIRSYTAGTIELVLGYNFDSWKSSR